MKNSQWAAEAECEPKTRKIQIRMGETCFSRLALAAQRRGHSTARYLREVGLERAIADLGILPDK